jgi:hypothetical protein
MADMLVTATEVGTLLGIAPADLDVPKATLLAEIATAIVQGETGRPAQRLVEVVDDTATLTGTTDRWLDLPQRPVTAVASVTLDGVALVAGAAGSGGATYRLRGDRLWRGDGWQTYVGEPSEVEIVYSHGYATGDQQLEFARSAVFGLIRSAYDNEQGLLSEKIDDYASTFDALSARMEASPHLQRALVRAYGRAAGMVRLG